MKHPSEENLLGYVLGALDAQEQRDVQESIDNDPQLEDRLLEIKSSILPLDYLDTAGQRPGLARRTCEFVASTEVRSPALGQPSRSSDSESTKNVNASEFQQTHIASRLLSNVSATSRQLLQPSTWSLPDFAVAVAIMAIVAGILFPTLSYTRHHSRVLACQNNMLQLGNAFLRYSDSHDGRFVEIRRSGPLGFVGAFAPILKDCGFVDDDSLFACAGNQNDSTPVFIPSIKALSQARGKQLCHFRRTMCGHYGYTMGYCTEDGYCPPQNLGRTNVVLLADMPSLRSTLRISANHGGRGQNCLFEDGHVQYVSGDSIGEDPLFFNDYNLVGPGCRPEDNVIAPSHLCPFSTIDSKGH